jgi:hypothetical protein
MTNDKLADTSFTGLVDGRGRRWVAIERGGTRAVIRIADFLTSPQDAFRQLSDRGLLFIGSTSQTQVKGKIEAISDWPPITLIDRVGWHEGHFALGDGVVISPRGAAAPEVVFVPNRGKWGVKGDVNAWRLTIARRLMDQPLPRFAVMVAFGPPLLDLIEGVDNYGYELVGRTSCGKSTVQRLAASVWGGGGAIGVEKWAETWGTTLNALEDMMQAHSDAFLVLDEGELEGAGLAGGARSQAKMDSKFKLAAGHDKRRLGQHSRPSSRLLYLSSTNTALSTVAKPSTRDVSDAAQVRLITIPADGYKFGVFRRVPKEFGSASEYVRRLGEAAGEAYGTPIRAFLESLVANRHTSEKKLKARLKKYIAKFMEAAEIDQNDGSAARVAMAFAIPYAAGTLAKQYGVLPRDWNCLAAALTCLRLSTAYRDAAQASPIARVRGYLEAHRTTIREVAKGTMATLSDDQVNASPGFLKAEKGGQTLLVPPRRFKTAFPDWKAVLAALHAEGRVFRDSANQKTWQAKRTVREGKTDRFFCIRISDP